MIYWNVSYKGPWQSLHVRQWLSQWFYSIVLSNYHCWTIFLGLNFCVTQWIGLHGHLLERLEWLESTMMRNIWETSGLLSRDPVRGVAPIIFPWMDNMELSSFSLSSMIFVLDRWTWILICLISIEEIISFERKCFVTWGK